MSSPSPSREYTLQLLNQHQTWDILHPPRSWCQMAALVNESPKINRENAWRGLWALANSLLSSTREEWPSGDIEQKISHIERAQAICPRDFFFFKLLNGPQRPTLSWSPDYLAPPAELL